jgi:hypothetical protein
MIRTAMRDGLQSLQSFSGDDILAALGLAKRRTNVDVLLPSVALFAAGAIVGAAAAVLLTPKTGPAMRRELTDGARDLSQRLGSTAQAVQEYVAGTGNRGGSNTTHTSSAAGTT